jgi:hypothetical protein
MKKTTWRSSLKNEMENEEEMDSYYSWMIAIQSKRK